GAMDVLTDTLVGGKDPDTGEPYTGDAATNPTWHFEPDPYGNVREVIDPKGFTLLYGYDETVATYRVSTLDAFGYASTAAWDLRFGTVTETTDINGNKEQFQVDDFGRPIAVFGPYDVGTSDPTIAFQYSVQPGAQSAAPTWALTRHKDVLHPGDPIDTVS